MHFMLLYEYVPDMATRRAPLRAQHLALVQRLHAEGTLLMAGAWSDPLDGAALVFNAFDRTAVEQFVKQDPYVSNSLVTKWRIREWNLVVGADPAHSPGTQ